MPKSGTGIKHIDRVGGSERRHLRDSNLSKRYDLKRTYHENWMYRIKAQKSHETFPKTWRDFTKNENLKLIRGSHEAGKHRPLPNTTKFYKTAGEMEAIQQSFIKRTPQGKVDKESLSGMTRQGAARFARGQLYGDVGGLDDDQIVHEVSKARMRDKAGLPKVQSKGKTKLLQKQSTRSLLTKDLKTKKPTSVKGGGGSPGGGGKFGWIRRALHRPASPWSLLKSNKNY